MWPETPQDWWDEPCAGMMFPWDIPGQEEGG
ncbi:hypothetical protein Nmel_017340 [Mimus melanotis]